MLILIEHNSNEIVNVFIGNNEEELLMDVEANMDPKILDELCEEYEWDAITIENLTSLYHDGDSENGFTLKRK